MKSYIIEGGVCYLVLTERAYPKRLAFNYLEELQKEFNLLYATEVDTATRPYAFIKFDSFIQKTKKLYMDTRAQRNVNKLNEDLADVHKIMMTNIHEVLGRGERLDSARGAARSALTPACHRAPAVQFWPLPASGPSVRPTAAPSTASTPPRPAARCAPSPRPRPRARSCSRRRDEALGQAARRRA